MITLLVDLISWALVLAGAFFMLVGGIGVLRLPDFFTRQHAAGVTDTMGANLILIALIIQSPAGADTVRLVLILAFLFITGPTASHALAQAAISTGIRPHGTDLRKDPNAPLLADRTDTTTMDPIVKAEEEAEPSNR